MSLYEGVACSWCGKNDLAVKMESPEQLPIMICIPCLNEVYEDWKADKSTDAPTFTRIK